MMSDKLGSAVGWLAANPEMCVFLALLIIATMVGLERRRQAAAERQPG